MSRVLKSGDINDFPDAFSPMLVKELRQGMRAKTFTTVFLGMQLPLGMLLWGAMLASESARTGSTVSGIIITFFVICVVIIQPLRGVHALSGEMRDQTIDLMTITRLTSWRIVLGKWVAIVSQSALLFVTIIPYLLLRYFFGGMNLLGEITILLCLFATSMMLTALTVGLSACKLGMVRILFPVGLLILLFFSSFGVGMFFVSGSGSLFMGGSGSTGDIAIAVALLLATFAYLGHQALSMGASMIAPAAENHAITRRFIALALVIILGATALMADSTLKDLWYLGIQLVAIPSMIIALTETSHVAPGLISRFKKRGPLGTLGAIFLLPGAASGYCFTLLLAGVVAITVFIIGESGAIYWDEYVIRLTGFWGTLLFPAALLRILHRGGGQTIGAYLLILIATLLLWVILQSFASVAGDQTIMLFAWCPVVFALGDVESFTTGTGISVVISAMLLLNILLAFPAVRTIKRMLRPATTTPTLPS